MCTPPLSAGGGGGQLNLLPNFQKGGGLTGPQLWDGVAGKEGVTFFRGVAIFTKEINLNLKYLITKKFYKQKYFSLS